MTQDDSCLNSFIQRVADYYQIVSSSRIPATQYEIDFRDLKNLSQDLKQSDDIEYQSCAGMIAENRKKNRYKDIAPFDATRVKLTMTNNDPNSDYINASFIQGADNRKSYIASQGPLPHTVLDFWQMLWQYNVNVVVMVCREIELGKKKCERYWANRGETKTFGSITVTSESDDNLEEGYCLRVMKVVNGQETRYIKQFHYTSWPDHGVPKTCYEIITLINHVRDVQSYSEDVRTPLCIHCSAGCGRTGAAIVLDYVRNLLDHKRVPPNLKTFDIIAQMRRQRPAIVQTKEQYEFVNVAISELFRIYMRTKTLKYKEFSVGYQGEEYVNVSISKDKPRNGNSLPRTAQYENFEPRSNGVGAPTWSDAPEEPPPKPKRPLSTMFPPSSNLDNTANSRKQSMPAVLGPPAKLNLRQRPAALAPVKSAPTEHSAVMPTKPNPAAKPAPPAKPQEAKRPAPTKPRRSFRRMPDRSSGEDSAPILRSARQNFKHTQSNISTVMLLFLTQMTPHLEFRVEIIFKNIKRIIFTTKSMRTVEEICLQQYRSKLWNLRYLLTMMLLLCQKGLKTHTSLYKSAKLMPKLTNHLTLPHCLSPHQKTRMHADYPLLLQGQTMP